MANIANDRTSVALTKQTIERLKTIAVSNKLRMYEMIEVMVNELHTDKEFQLRVIRGTKQLASTKAATKVTITNNIAKLPVDLKNKLRKMSVEELESLLRGDD